MAELTLRIDHTFRSGFRLHLSLTSVGETLALFGPSGAGKSTVLSMIAGTLRPDRGHIALGNEVLFDSERGIDRAPRHRRVGLVLQDPLLFPLLTVRENLEFGVPGRGGRWSLDRVAGLFEVETLLERQPRNLSGGERQRVALARAVLAEPERLLCDEPFSALDAARRSRLVRILAQVRDDLGIPLVLVTHQPREVLALADDVAILDAGALVDQGPPGEKLDALEGPGSQVPNFWIGEVTRDGRVQVGKHRLHVPLPDAAVGQQVRLAIDPSHVALAKTAEAAGTSPRNRLRGRVAALVADDGRIRVDVDVDAGVVVRALVTPAAVEELELKVGVEVYAVIKATAIEVLSVQR